jgi:hypothetical protein
VGADMPFELNIEALECVRDAVIEAFKKMGVRLEIAEQGKLPPLAEEIKSRMLKNQVKEERLRRGCGGSWRYCKHHRPRDGGCRSILNQEDQALCPY